MVRSSIFDDLPAVGRDADRLSAERLRNIALCACKRPDGGGEVDRSQCPIHRDPPVYEGCCLAPLQQQRAAWDGRRTVMRQAQCPAAALLQDLHLRSEPPQLRVITTVMRSVTGESFVVVERVERAE